MHFAIVTPVFNGARFLDETIYSVVTQAGDFTIRYHIQDGGSTDGTVAKLHAWRARLRTHLPILCRGIQFSFESAKDAGIYDAINRAFEIAGANADAMAYINADDRLAPGAVSIAAQAFAAVPHSEWLGGKATVIDETSALRVMFHFVPFPTPAIKAGLFDGRYSSSYMQQEGMFWRPQLWRAVGGFDSRFRVAGDFDLWRRMAHVSEYVHLPEAITGFWRLRQGQASAEKGAYHAEIDAYLSEDQKQARAAVSAQYKEAIAKGALHEMGFNFPVIRRPDGDALVYQRMRMHPDTLGVQGLA
ncbi:MAG: glycosyltransferase [Caulobacteraceae bacterium]